MRRSTFAAITVLALLVLSLAPTAVADTDGREGAQPGTPTPVVTETSTDGTGPDSDDDRARDIVHADDVIVDGSLSVGFDSYFGYDFGFDTIVLRENNLRILFDDTSVGSFPDNDWRIVINESANGGQEFYAIQDATSGRHVFKIRAGAPANALVVDAAGDLGLGTDNPATELHAVDSDTPTFRLQQDGSGGWGPQTWDVAGNETNFFIRDVSNGSTLPFRIRPGAPTSSIDVRADGKVGFGTSNPATAMHLLRSDGTAVLKVEETNTTKTNRQVLQLVNNGGAQFSFDNGTANWRAGSDNAGLFRLDVQDGPGDIEFRLDTAGNVEIAGTLTENSDVNAKYGFAQMDAAAILASVLDLQVSEWSYNGETVRHIGPMAQDFAAAFGLGAKTTSIATRDIAGVALLSIQALAAENAELRARVDTLEQRLADLEAKVNGG